MTPIDLIVACQEKGFGIGYHNRLPWKSRLDLNFFKETTSKTKDENKKNLLIIGRFTWVGIPKNLPKREILVISKNILKDRPDYQKGSLKEALEFAEKLSHIETIFIAGGVSVYSEILQKYPEKIRYVYLNYISTENDCDRFFTFYNEDKFIRISKNMIFEKDDLYVTFTKWCYKNTEEENWLNNLRDILDHGYSRDAERTGVGTLALFGKTLEFDISEKFPLLTSKRTPFRLIAEELLWFLSGSTDSKKLEEKNVNIWKGNSSRQFLDSRGLTNYKEGDIGGGYAFVWRHFGAEYINCDTDYTGKGFDQISHVISQIKENPQSRRLIVSAWDPNQESKTALMPCHCFFQFFVRESHLDCMLYQRSCDSILGQPFNIASYSLLTYMIAHVTGLKPGKFIHVTGDTHIYKNHVDKTLELVSRTPLPFPTLKIKRKVEDIFDFKVEDFEVCDYNAHPVLKFEMAV